MYPGMYLSEAKQLSNCSAAPQPQQEAKISYNAHEPHGKQSAMLEQCSYDTVPHNPTR